MFSESVVKVWEEYGKMFFYFSIILSMLFPQTERAVSHISTGRQTTFKLFISCAYSVTVKISFFFCFFFSFFVVSLKHRIFIRIIKVTLPPIFVCSEIV